MTPEDQMPDLDMDPNSLYREEVFTDHRLGTIRQMTPISADGSDDSSRPVMYAGQTQLLTPAGALPLNFEIEADSLQEAVSRFGVTARAALEQTMEEIKEMRRQAASSIVVPGAGGMDPGGPGGAMGGMPGGGIKMP
jgi:hypothetical protein